MIERNKFQNTMNVFLGLIQEKPQSTSLHPPPLPPPPLCPPPGLLPRIVYRTLFQILTHCSGNHNKQVHMKVFLNI